MLINQTLDKLDALGLFGMGLGLREQLESNQYISLSFDERLGLLVDRESETRDSRRLALRLKAAKLRQEATVEDIDFRAPRGLDRSVIMNLAQAGWVAAKHNLLISGPTGAGKSFIGCALAHATIRRGHTALYMRTPRLLADLALSRGDGRYVRRLARIAQIWTHLCHKLRPARGWPLSTRPEPGLACRRNVLGHRVAVQVETLGNRSQRPPRGPVLQHFHDVCHAQAPSSHSHSSARELWPEWFQAPRPASRVVAELFEHRAG